MSQICIRIQRGSIDLVSILQFSESIFLNKKDFVPNLKPTGLGSRLYQLIVWDNLSYACRKSFEMFSWWCGSV